MSTPISYSSINASQERLGFFKEKHDAYKSLISGIAEQLRPEDMGRLFWYIEAPPDLRCCSALEVLEHLQRLGKFSEKSTVQYLSDLMKDIKRIDLMKEVDSYSHNYVRHYSLPAVTVNPPPQPPRSFSFGNPFTHSTPCQETRPFLGHPCTPRSAGQAQQGSHLASVASGISDNTHVTQKPAAMTSPAQSYSMEGLSYPRWAGSAAPFTYSMISPGLEPGGDRQQMVSSLTDSRSLSNSGSIHLHYNSHPSSCNASQEAFHSEPPSVFMPNGEPPHFGEMHANPVIGMQMPLEHYNNISRPHSLSFPHPVHPNWYQHASLSSIPQEPENLVGQASCDPGAPPRHQHTTRHGSASEGLHSQESLSNSFYRRSQQVQPMPSHHYYNTPPYNRRTPVMVGHNTRTPRTRHQSISGYPVRADPPNRSEPSPPEHRAEQEVRCSKHYKQTNEELNEACDEVFMQHTSRHVSQEAAMNFTSTASEKLARENKCDVNRKEYLMHSHSPCDQNKALAHLEENLLANNSSPVVPRRRANSLHQDSEYKVQRVNKRLSVMSVDERHSIHHDSDHKTQRSNNRLSFISMDERRQGNHQQNAMQRSTSATSSAIGSTRQISGSRGHLLDLSSGPISFEVTSPTAELIGQMVSLTSQSTGSAIHSSGTLDSEDNHLSPTSSPSSSHRANGHAHRQKGTLLSRLTQQFSRVAKPHKEIEWSIKRNKLNKIIYEQKDKYLTCPFRLELDGGLKGSNPKLTLYVHPYGQEEDSNCSMTLEVGLEVPTQPNAQRLDSRTEVEVNVKAGDAERKVVFGSRTVRESIRLNYFYLKGFVSHQELKRSHSTQVLFTISANLVSTTYGLNNTVK